MRNQHDIDQFTLEFHKRALQRLREDMHLLDQARATLSRWRTQRGATASDPYLEAWRALLDQGPDAIEREVCADTDAAATLRNASPLGFVLTASERMAVHRIARA